MSLAKETLKDKGNVSRIIHRMVRDGWVELRQSKNGRAVELFLTKRGRKIRSQLPPLVRQEIGALLKPLSESEQADIFYALKKLRILLGDEDVVSF